MRIDEIDGGHSCAGNVGVMKFIHSPALQPVPYTTSVVDVVSQIKIRI